ncbi:hypothetical protein D7V21_09645 [Acinetobacter guerrae]|uniref:Uncharacterized protein n=1 Tax=Acinetobacter guerrae TaxID=1843371 RepID=A0A3A8ETT3_9GAMM|nr:hypothetical protein [Acinetobacter guerrae]RKG33424.1 hypothetical protein D7V21_09645 [Acinetobacter guerrae]
MIPKYCDHCWNGDDDSVFPYYGLAPHVHYKRNGLIVNTVFLDASEYPANFEPDEESGNEQGMYTHCLECGAGKNSTLIESLKEVS